MHEACSSAGKADRAGEMYTPGMPAVPEAVLQDKIIAQRNRTVVGYRHSACKPHSR